jgi:hypothetical protein
MYSGTITAADGANAKSARIGTVTCVVYPCRNFDRFDCFDCLDRFDRLDYFYNFDHFRVNLLFRYFRYCKNFSSVYSISKSPHFFDQALAESMSVGVQLFDNDHKHLIAAINQIIGTNVADAIGKVSFLFLFLFLFLLLLFLLCLFIVFFHEQADT